MKRIIFFTLLIAFYPVSIFSQNKLAIDDKVQFLSIKADSLLVLKLNENSIEYSNIVDFKYKCDYHFAEFSNFQDALILKIKDCDDKIIGEKNLGVRVFNVSDEEKIILVSYAIIDIIEEPGKYIDHVIKIESDVVIDENAENKAQDEEIFDYQENEHNTRHFFAPSSHNLRKGELYYNTIYFLIHDIQYGISDKFSMGMGSTIGGFPFYLTPKVTFPVNEKTTIALGDLFILGTYSVDFVANLSYATITYGSEIKNFTIGLGYLATTEGDVTGNTNSLVFNVSGMTKISDYIYFISETYFFGLKNKQSANYNSYNEATEIYTYYDEEFIQKNFHIVGITGFRFINKNRDVRSFQAGLSYLYTNYGDVPAKYSTANWYTTANENPTSIFIFPTVSFTQKFGKKY